MEWKGVEAVQGSRSCQGCLDVSMIGAASPANNIGQASRLWDIRWSRAKSPPIEAINQIGLFLINYSNQLLPATTG